MCASYLIATESRELSVYDTHKWEGWVRTNNMLMIWLSLEPGQYWNLKLNICSEGEEKAHRVIIHVEKKGDVFSQEYGCLSKCHAS